MKKKMKIIMILVLLSNYCYGYEVEELLDIVKEREDKYSQYICLLFFERPENVLKQVNLSGDSSVNSEQKTVTLQIQSGLSLIIRDENKIGVERLRTEGDNNTIDRYCTLFNGEYSIAYDAGSNSGFIQMGEHPTLWMPVYFDSFTNYFSSFKLSQLLNRIIDAGAYGSIEITEDDITPTTKWVTLNSDFL